jgi:hypothetical protein
MLSFDSRPPTNVDRTAPVARGRWCWPALLPACALVLDALWPLPPALAGPWLTWLDLAAITCVGWAALGPRRAHRHDWGTPVDGRVVAGLALAVLHVVRAWGVPEPLQWLHQIAASGVCFYALGARLRRDALAPDAIWPGFAVLVLALSAYALGHATQGIASLIQATHDVDARWLSEHGLAKSLLVASLLCAGRAAEHGARPLWRVTALVGAVACAVCTFAGGSGLGVQSLANLDEPFYFGTSIVAVTFLAGLTRLAWMLGAERALERARWRAAAVAFQVIAALLLFGGTSGGEGLRALAALAGAAVIATRAAPPLAAIASPPRRAQEPPIRKAA